MIYYSASIFTKRIVAAKQMWRIYTFAPIGAYSIQFISFDLDPIQSLVLRKEKEGSEKKLGALPPLHGFRFNKTTRS